MQAEGFLGRTHRQLIALSDYQGGALVDRKRFSAQLTLVVQRRDSDD